MFKKLKGGMLLAFLALILILVGCSESSNSDSDNETASNYPERDLNGTIQWGEGGATDIISRTIAPLAEDALGKSIILTNRTGASGAVAAQYVYDQEADGHNLLFATEGQALFGVLGVSDLGYDEFYPINILGRTVSIVAVPADSPFETMEELLEYGQKNPEELKLGSSGPGSNSEVVANILSLEKDVEFNSIPYDGSGPALTAMLGGHVDLVILNVIDAIEYVESGDIRILTAFNDTEVEQFPGVPPIVEVDSSFEKYLGWTEFFGVFVKKETPDDVKETLVKAFQTAFETEEFQERLEQSAIVPMGIHGEEADEFIKNFQSVTAWILHDSGSAKVSPEELGIPRID